MHQCKRCSQDTDNYRLCNDCIDKEIEGLSLEEATEILDRLFDLELDAWYAANGY